MSKHFTLGNGCPNDTGREKETLRFTLIDYINVSKENLIKVGHKKGAKCRCSECNRRKALEDSWILRMGTFYGDGALNSRDEIQAKTRCNWNKFNPMGARQNVWRT